MTGNCEILGVAGNYNVNKIHHLLVTVVAIKD